MFPVLWKLRAYFHPAVGVVRGIAEESLDQGPAECMHTIAKIGSSLLSRQVSGDQVVKGCT